uniref:Baseplate protein J-like barrel domain-containing protein n=1 Tax=Thermogemmatispora argillosa TaxID=2045280 RepID=A0A455T987_9CHLR|nr:hypothetical protein KTA_41980 [Thermogemmatispora argillosa]
MRQADGSELLGAGDPRAEEIGVIYVAPTDERKDVLVAILTQEKLGRKQIAIVLPEQNRAFQRRVDFEVLKMRRNPQARLVFIAPPRSEPAEYARQRRFPVYSSLDNFVRSLQDTWEKEEARDQRGQAWPQRLRRLLRLRGEEGEAASAGRTAGASRQKPGTEASAVPPEPSRPAFRGISPGGVAAAGAAGAAAGAAAGMGWSALRREREREREREQGGATEAAADQPLAEAGAFEEDLPPVEGAVPPAAARKSAAASAPVVPQGPGPAEEPEAPPISLPEAGAPAARALEEEQEQEAVKAGSPPPRVPSSQVEPGIIRFPHSRRITAKLPAASSAYAPEGEAAQRGGGPAAGAAAGALAGAAAGAAFAAAGSSGAAGGGSAGAGGATAAPPSGVSTLPPPLTPLRQRGSGQRRRGGLWLLLAAILLLLLLIGCGALAAARPALFGTVAAMMPFGSPGATVTITPTSRDLKNQYVITGVTGRPDAAQRQVQARLLTAAPAAQTKTVQATGHGQTPGVQAKGTITFSHNAGQDESVLQGTFFYVRGMKVVTDATAYLPAGNSSTSVPAHVEPAGSAGNLPAGAVNQYCCGPRLEILAVSSAFTGGQDPQSFTYVQQSDIDSAANPLKASLAQQAQQQFQRQIRAGEQLIGQPNCSTNVKSDHRAGDHASSVTVTVSASCSGEAFDKQTALRLGASLLSQEASKSLGPGYAPVGQIVTTINGAAPISGGQGTISITVAAEGRWAYQFDSARKESLAHLIAGKTRNEALQLLQRQTGIQAADIAIAHGSDRLPSDANQITITINSVSGLTPVPSASSGSGSPPATAPTTPVPGSPGPAGKG